MDKAFNRSSFVSGLLLLLAGTGMAINFFLRSKRIDIPVISLLVIGLAMTYSGWKRSRRE
ncbi:hypothetical protein D3C77_108330 [compost metagenome]